MFKSFSSAETWLKFFKMSESLCQAAIVQCQQVIDTISWATDSLEAHADNIKVTHCTLKSFDKIIRKALRSSLNAFEETELAC